MIKVSKIIEFENVYLELPDDYELKEEKKESTNDNSKEEENTIKMSLEELQRKLEETQSLHL